MHVSSDKILATEKHSHFDSNRHLHVLSAAFQEVADAFHPLILNVVEMEHWEHVLGCWAGVDDVEFARMPGTA